MNTMHNDYLYRIKLRRIMLAKTLDILYKIVVVISIYLVFGQLCQQVY